MSETSRDIHDGTVSPITAIQSFDSFDDVMSDVMSLTQNSPSTLLSSLSPKVATSPSTPQIPLISSNQHAMAMTNAVHMEVQENAKIPTFNLAVDRSNSVSHQRHASWTPLTEHAVDEMMRLTENDFNLTEMFLQSEDRSSEQMAYSNAGTSPRRRDRIGNYVDRATGINTAGNTALRNTYVPAPLSPSLTPVDPMNSFLLPLLSPTSIYDIKIDTPYVPTPTTLNSYYPQERSLPLPITKKAEAPTVDTSSFVETATLLPANPSQPKEDLLTIAIATAAAIACRQNTPPSSPPSSETTSGPSVPIGSEKSTKSPIDPNTGVVYKNIDDRSNMESNTPVGLLSQSKARILQTTLPLKKLSTATSNITPVGFETILRARPSPEIVPKSKATTNHALHSISTDNYREKHATTKSTAKHHKLLGMQSMTPPPLIQNHRSTYTTRPVAGTHAAAHTTPSASIVEATKQRSQFGFGGNHVVPSVPLPPPTTKNSNKGANPPSSIFTSTTPLPRKGSSCPANKKPPPVLPSIPPVLNPCVAYERKKQRAKDARVNLNDSIERLAIAISLGGTQSRERANQLKILLAPPVGSKVEEFRSNTLQIMGDCTKASDASKKWDRPSFVGTGAALIQGLNSQCDALMREMVELKNFIEQQGNTSVSQRVGVSSTLQGICNSKVSTSSDARPKNLETATMLPTSSVVIDKNLSSLEGLSKRTKTSISFDSEGSVSEIKRQKTSDFDTVWTETNMQQGDNAGSHLMFTGIEGDHQRPIIVSGSSSPNDSSQSPDTGDFAMNTVFSTCSVLQIISAYTDPRSLIRCSAVSKQWANLNVFQSENVWLDRCAQRYGLANVRKWKEKGEDENIAGSSPISSLYQLMDTSNVRPNCQYEVGSLIGEARMPGIASAWVFMVERSNGETLRSVRKKTEDSMHGGIGEYTSLPVVELRILIQNTGVSDAPITLKNQILTVDAGTRRRGEEMSEIHWDDRLKKTVLNVDGSRHRQRYTTGNNGIGHNFCQLRLFESAVIVLHIHARGCSTSSKFKQRANFAKVIMTVGGITVPLVAPFARERPKQDLLAKNPE